MTINIKLLPRRSTQERLWKTLNLVVGFAMVLNMSFAGWAFAPKVAAAAPLPADAASTIQTPSPTPPAPTDPGTCTMQLTKSVVNLDHPNGPNSIGDTLEYTIAYTNIGTGKCTGGGVRIDDTIPAGLWYNGNHTQVIDSGDVPTDNTSNPVIEFGFPYGVSIYPPAINGTSINAGDPMVVWDLNTVSPGEKGHVTFQAKITETCGCTFENHARAFAVEMPVVNNEVVPVLSNVVKTELTNSRCSGNLTLTKVVENNYGGTAQPNDFDLTAGGAPVLSGVATLVTPNTNLAINETQLPGYEFVGITGEGCPSDLGGTVNIAAGHSLACTITNRDIQPKLTVTKIVHGGTLGVSDFPLLVNQTTVASGVENGFNAGDYTVSETSTHPDYVGVISGNCGSDGSITLHIGDVKTCTITNTYTPTTATLTVIKHVVNNFGGTADPDQFTMTINGINATPNNSFNGADAPGVARSVAPGDYTVTETGPAGYSSSMSTNCAGAIAAGESKTCTITNTAIQPKLIVIKKVVGADVSASNFQLTVSGTNASPASFAGADDPGTPVGLDVGSYTVNEQTYANFKTSMSPDCNGTIALGETKTCTVTNTYQSPAVLTIDKLVNGAKETTVAPGSILNYAVTITNSGDQTAYGVQVVDALPPHLGNIVVSGGTYNAVANTITWNNLTIPGQSQIVLTFQATVDTLMPFGTTDLANTATLGCTNRPDTNIDSVVQGCPFSGQSSVVTHVPATATIVITKSGAATVTPGNTLTYTLAWGITGNAAVTQTLISDALPTNTTFVSANCGTTTGTCTINSSTSTITWDLGTRLPYQGQNVTLTVRVNSPLANHTIITNTGVFSTHENPPVSSTVNTIVNSAPQLSITKTNNISPFTNPGKTVTYTTTVTNAAGATATAVNVIMTDVLPNGFVFDSGLGTKSFSLGSIAPGTSVVTTYTVTINANEPAGTYTNTATAKGDNTDPVVATSNVDVRVPQVQGASSVPALTIKKSVSPTATTPGGIVTYTVTITNIGDATATNVTVADTLPKGFTFIDTGLRTRTYVLGTLAAGHTRVIHYDVQVATTIKAGTYKNYALLTADDLEQLHAIASVKVTVPEVLGLATTGPGIRDYFLFLTGLSLAATGLFLARSRRHAGTFA